MILRQSDAMISQYLPTMKAVGLVNENNQLDIELTKDFINSAFEKSGNVTMYDSPLIKLMVRLLLVSLKNIKILKDY